MKMEILDKLRKHPAAPERHFAFPHEVVDDPSLSSSEKRAILCQWASDRCAVESFPTLRWLPGTTFPVTFSAVMDALGQLDRCCRIGEEDRLAHRKRPTVIPLHRRGNRTGSRPFGSDETAQLLQA
jgi:hypothetical protein